VSGAAATSASELLSLAAREIWLAAIVGVAVALVSWGLRGRHVAFRQALWGLVLLRLVLPPGLAHPLSLASLLPAFGEAVEWTGDGVSGAPTTAVAPTSAPAAPAGRRWPAAAMLSAWAAGTLLLLGRDAARVHRWRRLLRSADPVTAAQVTGELERLRQRLGIRRAVRLVATPMRITPFNMGLIRPTIVVPRLLLDPAHSAALTAALAHELAHVARWDPLLLWLQQVVARVYFFHPFVWLAMRHLDAGRESLSDALVVAKGAMPPRVYARGLLRALELDLPGTAALGLGTHSRRSVMRIRAIVDSGQVPRRASRWSLVGAAAFGLLVLPLGSTVSGARLALSAEGEATASPSLSNPLPGGRLTAPYGASQRHPFTGKPYFHTGVDLAADAGTPVRSAGAGVVETATDDYDLNKNSGTVVVVDHGKGLKTFYAHLGELRVEAGQRVVAGQQIAVVGMSGLTTGPHIHLEVWRDGKHVDPGAEVDGIPPAPGAPAAKEGAAARQDFDEPPQLLHMRQPQYPKQAFDAKIEGKVLLDVDIDATGKVVGARIVKSVPGLDEAALTAVRQWTFRPAMKDGKPVATTVAAPVTFRIG